MMKTGILFDLDGTLLDTLADLADSVNHVLASFSYPQRTVEEVRQFVGNGAARLIAQAVPEGANPAPVLAAFQLSGEDERSRMFLFLYCWCCLFKI